ncbi:MAG TPA: MFS transporter [Ramlibacter sp.]|nr:MFS transporter [Ramlibacter sp.]
MPTRDAVPAVPFRLIILLVLGHVAFAGDRFTLTLQAVALKASPLAIGILMSLLMVVPMLLSIHMGRWADRLGYARPAALGLGMLAAAGLLAGLVPSMPALYATSVFVGSGYTLAHVAINNAVGQMAPARHLTRSFSTLALGFSVSGLTGPMVAGVVIDHFGHAAAFFALLGFALVALALLLPLAREGEPLPARAASAEPAGVVGLLRHAPLRAVLIASGLLSMGWDMFMFLAPLHGVRSGLSATSTGMLMGAFGAGTFAIRLLLPLFNARMSEWRTLSWALFVTALCYVVFPLAATLPLMLAAAFAMGLSLGCGQPMAMSLLHLTAPPSRAGEAVGMRTTIVSASQTLFPLLFGALGSALGVAAVFWAGATVLASGGAFARRRD